jgi:hypothetical protein
MKNKFWVPLLTSLTSRSFSTFAALLLGLVSARADDQQQQPQPPAIEPRAERVLHSACDYLAEAPFFVLKSELWRERVTSSGEKLQFTRAYELHVRRPDHLHADLRGSFSHREFWYDGKTLSVLDDKQNLYSTVDLSGALDSAFDAAQKDYSIDLPLVDLAVSNPYASVTAKVQKGRYLAMSSVLGVQCHHLAFTQENIDWQIWIEDGPRPLIKKIVINHKLDPGQPQFTAILSDWDFQNRIANSDFEFEAPPGASKIQMEKPAADQASGEPDAIKSGNQE